jgi:hypothetical protein
MKEKWKKAYRMARAQARARLLTHNTDDRNAIIGMYEQIKVDKNLLSKANVCLAKRLRENLLNIELNSIKKSLLRIKENYNLPGFPAKQYHKLNVSPVIRRLAFIRRASK